LKKTIKFLALIAFILIIISSLGANAEEQKSAFLKSIGFQKLEKEF
jgi:hypothetical protein